jgi:hypothetical protein
VTDVVRLKISQPALKLKMLPTYPAGITASSPILLNMNGGNVALSFDINALEASLLPWIAGLMGLTQRTITAAGTVVLSSNDNDIIVIKKTVGAATTVDLPTAASRIVYGLTANKVSIRIVDGKYDAATNNITIVPSGSDTIMGGANYIIDSNGGSIMLTPLADGSGWV